jgi:4-hydroxy-3-methylbut-2-enyl diphosphate reductase IspH
MGKVEDVRIAKRTGFCYGVREAVDKAKEAADAGRVTHTLGQVVHNEGVVASLHARGVQPIKALEEAREGSTVVIRAHGVTPMVRRDAAPGSSRSSASCRSSSRTATRSSCSGRRTTPRSWGS